MRFINLVDVEGKRHVVNPLHITAIDETDAGCVVHFRGRDTLPIVLTDTVEVKAGRQLPVVTFSTVAENWENYQAAPLTNSAPSSSKPS